jgi:hypothetical protein
MGSAVHHQEVETNGRSIGNWGHAIEGDCEILFSSYYSVPWLMV